MHERFVFRIRLGSPWPWGFVLTGFVLAGCSTYRAQPLSAAAVDAALQPAALETVKIAAAKFQHPLIAPLTIDGRDGFTPDEIAVMTVITSPKLRALRDQLGVTQAQVVQAGLLPNPQFGYTLDRLDDGNVPDLVEGKSLGLSWELTSLLTRHDRVAAAKATARSLDLSIAWQEWQAAQDSRLRAFRLLSLEQRLPLARDIEADLADTLALTQRAVALGQRVAPDLRLAYDNWTQAQNNRFALEQRIVAERAALNLALGQRADLPLRLKPAAVMPPLPPSTAEAARMLDGFEERRLDLVALKLGYESQEATLRAAVKAQFPKIGIDFGQANDTSDVRTHSYGVTVDLPLFDRGQGQIAIDRATRRQLFDEYVVRVAEARAEVAQLLSNLAIIRAQLRTVEESLPALEQLVAAFEQALKTHNADEFSYRETRGALAARRMERSQLQLDGFELSVALEIAAGRPLLRPVP